MMKRIKIPSRFTLIIAFVKWFLLMSFVLRIVFFIWQSSEVSWNIFNLIFTFLTGLFFDIGTVSFLIFPSIVYYFILPDRYVGSVLDKVIVWFFTGLGVFVLVLTFFAEVTFWDEFKSRFNFIAVDYLIYTHEVISNIEQSYPLPLLVSGVAFITIFILWFFYKTELFNDTFAATAPLDEKGIAFIVSTFTAAFYILFITNSQAEWSTNRYNSEISKSGIYSFFSAFRNNQMKYKEFYTSISDEKAIKTVQKKITDKNSKFTTNGLYVHRMITDSLPSSVNKNVVFILVESLSAKFMHEFGNQRYNTPFLDSLAQKSIFFKNLYATGTRTVRGMEAVTLSIPPTPGQSIVKRPENANLYSISNVFKSRNYTCNFFYGGDGYFDNMNSFFGGNGFNIYDRGRGSVLRDDIKTTRHNISDNEVTFENAWGICDQDIYNKMIKVADRHFKSNQLFFNFIMTTSNHKPYTYPSGKVMIPSGMSREGAVQYTDFAMREFFEKSAKKPWFKNTVFVIIADHCASSAGKDEIDVENYHIPAFIVNLNASQNQKIIKQCSQIDIFPTLFALMHWSYESDFFGKNVTAGDFEERAFCGTYRKLALIKGSKAMILSDGKKQNFYKYNHFDNSLTPLAMNQNFLDETISWYQAADYLFTNKLLK